MIWVEHYPDRAFVCGRPGLEERFDLVTFQRARPDHFRKPEWQPIPKAAVERLIGQPLESVRT